MTHALVRVEILRLVQVLKYLRYRRRDESRRGTLESVRHDEHFRIKVLIYELWNEVAGSASQ